ncbi:hypothetical protein D9M71_228040 [compost metagenome]
MPGNRGNPGAHDDQFWVALKQVRGYSLDPAHVNAEMAEAADRRQGVLDDLHHIVEIRAQQRMAHGFREQSFAVEPLCGAQVQLAGVDRTFGQALAEKFGEHRVPAVPLVALLQVYREHEQIACLERGDHFCRVVDGADMGGQLHVEAAQDRDLLHELEQRGG